VLQRRGAVLVAALVALAFLAVSVAYGRASSANRSAADPAAGKQVFAQAGCGACHTLAAAGSKGTIGPNLDQRRPTTDRVAAIVSSGSGVMPSFRGRLSVVQIENVAAFVSGTGRPVTPAPKHPAGATPAPGAGPGPAAPVRVLVAEWVVVVRDPVVRPGRVSLVIHNAGDRRQVIELVPIDSRLRIVGGRVAPGVRRLARIAVASGRTARKVMTLKAGRIAVVSGLPGRATRGMRDVLLVRVPAGAAPAPPVSSATPPPVADGKALFTSLCAGCHALADAAASGTIGPNLDEERPSCDKVVERVSQGEERMPSFAGTLTRAQIRRIARYVAAAVGRSGDGCG
jgi:mono/diheme cytochrome c family protein